MNGDRDGTGPQADHHDSRSGFSHHYAMNDASRLWAKRYRTEIAAFSSSLVSTSVTVSVIENRDVTEIVTISQFPLDSVKTRMQALVNSNDLSLFP